MVNVIARHELVQKSLFRNVSNTKQLLLDQILEQSNKYIRNKIEFQIEFGPIFKNLF